MPLATTRRTGLVDQVIDQLRASVTAGEYPIGTKIPTEPALSETLGVGRNTVREAVRALAHGGILEVRQGDGTYVRATSEVSGALRRLCGSELREVLQVRRCLEVEGARLAASARTADDLAELWQLLHRRDELQRENAIEDFVRADADLHFAVVRSAHNTVLTELYRGLTEVVLASVATTTHETAAAAHIRHRGLVEAIDAGDVDRAAQEAGGFLDELLGELPDQA
ncbi:FadR family transcriptional regulator [Mycolicibacterium fluoranthenivorans]|uniref:FadR family transcriptional regulator n=1 Tax=Mycolicibacterium fluoranthenivorans TaxID=258505 RepID=A0A1G4WPL6_9MYCO|nr:MULTISPECIES: FadR/GntR family transcriptional regulator [Mycobacteriaceae]MCV7251124.1 FadR family transcriptional regulator [Mycobacterium hackensackense]QNJ90684.1 FadR family transcriptional regulator [Mycolicibacterium fluoranthenivorans]SCX27021.1 transcriptional regulator, GntR family [Mycolicibacterium fluoranthenivorans]